MQEELLRLHHQLYVGSGGSTQMSASAPSGTAVVAAPFSVLYIGIALGIGLLGILLGKFLLWTQSKSCLSLHILLSHLSSSFIIISSSLFSSLCVHYHHWYSFFLFFCLITFPFVILFPLLFVSFTGKIFLLSHI